MTNREMHDLTEYEVEHSARLLISLYGADAEALAEMRVNEMVTEHNSDGAIAWTQILKAIRNMRAQEPKIS